MGSLQGPDSHRPGRSRCASPERGIATWVLDLCFDRVRHLREALSVIQPGAQPADLAFGERPQVGDLRPELVAVGPGDGDEAEAEHHVRIRTLDEMAKAAERHLLALGREVALHLGEADDDVVATLIACAAGYECR